MHKCHGTEGGVEARRELGVQLQWGLQVELRVAEPRARGCELPALGTAKGSGDVVGRRLESKRHSRSQGGSEGKARPLCT